MQKSILLLLILGLGLSSSMAQKTYEKEWKEIESLINKGLPQSALKIADSIYLQSKAENNAPQFLKAALYQIKLASDYQEDFMESSIDRIGKEIETAKAPVKQILCTIRAELYWQYYQGNRYRFLDRTKVSIPEEKDIKTWDMQTLVKAVANDYQASLENAEVLKNVKLDTFDPILQTAEGSKVYRPTLYDFLVFRAVEFFSSEEPGVIKPAAGFPVDSEAWFAPSDKFANFDLPAGFENDFTFIALSLYQDLLVFHFIDKDAAAMIDADLARLKFVHDKSILSNKDDLYLEALQNLQNNYPSHSHSADVAYEIAQQYLNSGGQFIPYQTDTNRWDVKKAKEICDKTVAAFPDSKGAQNCAILLRQIAEPSLSFTLNYANVPDQPFLGLLNFKNVKTVYFRIIALDPEKDRNKRQQERGENMITNYLAVSPLKEWTLELPDAGDYQQHSTQVRIPGLPVGYYIVLASNNKDFSVIDNPVAYAACWVTNISYISENDQDKGGMEVFVLDRQKGTPLKGVKAQVYVREYNYQERNYINKALGAYNSDESGYFAISAESNQSKSFYIEFTQGSDRYFTENYFYISPAYHNENSYVTTYFFTDRSIYRPGQTIYFKGIVIETTGDKSVIKPDYTSVVTFNDVNGQKVSELALTTNEFGSFKGIFTAPSGGLTGEMRISNDNGSTGFSVEEYKRPRFKVEVDTLEGSYKLNETVNVTGKTMNYSGAAVDQAEVSYRVVRNVRFPWRPWWGWFPMSQEAEITSGKTMTDASGEFKFSFNAIPDLQVDKKFKPIFTYQVYVDVTDITGEVRSAQESIQVGYQALILDLDIPEMLNPARDNSFKLTATNLNGRPVPVEGKITVYPLDAPARLIRDKAWGRPDVFTMSREDFLKEFPNDIYDDSEIIPENWAKKPVIIEKAFKSAIDSAFSFDNPGKLAAGEYVLVLEAADAFGEKVEVKKYFTVYDPKTKQAPVFKPFWYVVTKNSGEPGDTASIILGTGEKGARILYEIENDGKVISREWLQLSQEKTKLDIPIKQEYRGNFFVNFVFVKANRSYQAGVQISVPFTDKQLKITTETFRDKLTPGQEEQWKLRISGMNGEKVAAELLASMYDASLDAFREHQWAFWLYPYRYQSNSWAINAFTQTGSRLVFEKSHPDDYPFYQVYDALNWFGFNYYGSYYPRMAGGMEMRVMKNAMPAMDGQAAESPAPGDVTAKDKGKVEEEQVAEKPAAVPDVPVRRNFSETAFFFPALQTDENGDVILNFTVPESLTAWKLMALAYTKDLKIGQLEKDVVTRKELMVMTNAPRFFRERDKIFFSAKLVSLSEQLLKGKIEAEFFDAYTMKPVNDLLGNPVKSLDFSIDKGNSAVFTWELTIPSGLEAVVCRVKAASGEFTDGEEVVVPVLPNRMLVTESLPLPINGKGTKSFKFDKLAESGKSTTIKSYRLTLEFTSNPAWYAVQALPYLAEYPHESADGLFARYYANKLASYIANSNPKIRQVFENWKNITPDALLSNLEKNQELKAVLLNETPWVMEAKNETERKKRIALLFDLNRMADEEKSSLEKLRRTQTSNGGWSWFEGMPDNRYTTQLIVTGFGKLNHLGVIDLKKDPVLMNMTRQAFAYLEQRVKEDYDKLKDIYKDKIDDNHLTAPEIQYLYAYSFLKDIVQQSPDCREAHDYFLGQAGKYWTSQNKYMQAMIALALYRIEPTGTPSQIIKSLKENALYSDELGMYWRDAVGYYWYEAPVERQAMLIEAFTEVTNDREAVEQMKIWLLKQKQTQDWKTSTATAEAVYALLLRGVDLLASDQLVEVTLGNEKIDPLALDGVQVQAGTGYFQVSKTGSEIKPESGNVTVVKKDEGIAWGSLYWQYFEDLDKITPAKTPLSIEKQLFIERNTPSGPVLEPINDNTVLKTGDRVKVRVVIRTDRDMEYVHMKDMRAAAFEPVAALSGYRYQDGLGYYESIRDASVNFYFDYLRKGTYVFEYPLNVTQKGEFSNGITSIQCLYAPEFSAHSQGARVKVE